MSEASSWEDDSRLICGLVRAGRVAAVNPPVGIVAAAAEDPSLKKQTLTNLYNERPIWPKLAHRKLDEAVMSAYAAIDPVGNWSPHLGRNLAGHRWRPAIVDRPPLAARRAEVEPQALANLLRLNGRRQSHFISTGT